MSTTPIVTRISDYRNPLTGATAAADGDASGPAFSGDGRVVVYTSLASNIDWEPHRWKPDLEAGGPVPDLFVHVIDSGFNANLTLDLAPVKLPSGLTYAGSAFNAAVSPVNPIDLYLVAFVTDSAGWGHWVGANLYSTYVPISNGSNDIAFASFQLFRTADGSPTEFRMLGSQTYMVGLATNDADVVGTPAFSGDGNLLGFIAHGGDEVHTVRLASLGTLGSDTFRLRAAEPIHQVALSHDGHLIAFDTAAHDFDLDNDGTFETHFGPSVVPWRNEVFVFDLVTRKLARLTADQDVDPAINGNGATLGNFVVDPSGQSTQLTLTSLAVPGTADALPVAQAMVFTWANNGWAGEVLSTTWAGTPAQAGDGATGASGAAPAGLTWVGFTDDAQDLPDAPQGNSHSQAWVGGSGLAPTLVSIGDPNSGSSSSNGANAEVRDLRLSPVTYSPADVDMLTGQALGTYRLATYVTTADNLLGAPQKPGTYESIVLATFDAPLKPPPPPPATLDYRTIAGVTHAVIDAPANSLVETLFGNTVTTTIASRIGRAYTPGEPLTLVNPPSGTVRLGSGDDTLVYWLGTNDTAVVDIDGGAGQDTWQFPVQPGVAQYEPPAYRLTNFERLQFDPTATSLQNVVAWLGMPSTSYAPAYEVVGSPAPDLLAFKMGDSTGLTHTLDLRGLRFTGWTPGDDALHVYGAVGGPSEVWANGSTSIWFVGQGLSTVHGSPLDDHLFARWGGGGYADHFDGGAGNDWIYPGDGADVVDGGPGFDVVGYGNALSASTLPTGVVINLGDGLPEHGGDAEGDVLVGIEAILGTEADDWLAGDDGPNEFGGHNGNDTLLGGAGDDGLYGGLGNDRLTGDGGNDTLVGDAGDDVAVFSGPRSAYVATFLATPGTLYGGNTWIEDLRPGSPEGKDLIFGVERFQFDDGVVTLDQLLHPHGVAWTGAVAGTLAEDTPGGQLIFSLTRSGSDLGMAESVTVRVGPGSISPALADDVGHLWADGVDLGSAFGDHVVSFAPGEATKLVKVDLVADTQVEPDEKVLLQIVGFSGGVIDAAASEIQGTIISDDRPPPPQVSIAPVGAAAEGTSSSFSVLRWGDLSSASTVVFRVQGGADPAADTLDIGSVVVRGLGSAGQLGNGFGDYQLRFEAGQSALTLDIQALADGMDEPDEHLQVQLLSATGATLMAGQSAADATLIDIDPPAPQVWVLPDAGSATEGGDLWFRVYRGGADLSVTTEVTARIMGGTPPAADKTDFDSVTFDNFTGRMPIDAYRLVFGPGETSKVVRVQLTQDQIDEPDEHLGLTLMSITGGTLMAGATYAEGLILDDDLPPPSVWMLADAGRAAEGSDLVYWVYRGNGDLSLPTTATVWVHGGGTPSADEQDFDLVQIGAYVGWTLLHGYTFEFAPGEQAKQIKVHLRQDLTDEPDEHLQVELLSVTDGVLVAGQTVADGLIIDDDPSRIVPKLLAEPAVAEGQAWTLQIVPASGWFDPLTLEYVVRWGDGQPELRLTGAQLASQGDQVQHVFADDASGTANSIPLTVQVAVILPATLDSGLVEQLVQVQDVAPTARGFAFAASRIDHDTLADLQLGTVTDVPGDPVLLRWVDWGDLTVSPDVGLSGTVQHSYTRLGTYEATGWVRNDDGDFKVATATVSITAQAGAAQPNGTPAQWATAWTDSLMAFSHKKNLADAAEPWSVVTLTAVGSGSLAGGDLYGGALGVSGTTATSSTVRQEIDGSEALRIALQPGNRADALVLDVGRLFTNDAPGGLREAGRVQFYDGTTLVAEQLFAATQADGHLHLAWSALPKFNSVVLSAGALDSAQVFHAGGLANGQGLYTALAGNYGSDYLVESVEFLLLGDVPLVGVPGG